MFGCLRQSIFAIKSSSTGARRRVYLVGATLLYGSKAWAVKAGRLEMFGDFRGYLTSTVEGSHLV